MLLSLILVLKSPITPEIFALNFSSALAVAEVATKNGNKLQEDVDESQDGSFFVSIALELLTEKAFK